ncbi:MAG TPA: tRNA (guanosine(46)-N7)-methyltransferase TrmB [SAR86 cluster bacterium]|nr:tRNA (guanosine(46)-N7)-methyltransferase TrmB [SAR86 cluster bacterium]
MTFNSKSKSFVTRQGRITSNQRKALDSFWNQYVISELSAIQGFIRGNYSLLDIGFGAGETLVSIAQKNKDISLLGAEVYQSGIGTVLSKADKFNLENIRIVNEDAEDLLQNKILNNSFDAIIMFYPDPWPKRRHHKRRLIKKEFIELLNKKLKPNGIFYFKTDWKDYFDKVNLLFEGPNWEELNLIDLEEHLRDIPSTSFEKKAIHANRSLNTKIVKKVN